MTDVTRDMAVESSIPRICHIDEAEVMGLDDITRGLYGDIRYRAPEAVKGKPYNFKADVWSLGVILYFLFVGKLPFTISDDISDYSDSESDQSTKNRIQLIEQKILNTEPDYALLSSKGFSEQAIDLIQKLLNKDPMTRLTVRAAL